MPCIVIHLNDLALLCTRVPYADLWRENSNFQRTQALCNQAERTREKLFPCLFRGLKLWNHLWKIFWFIWQQLCVYYIDASQSVHRMRDAFHLYSARLIVTQRSEIATESHLTYVFLQKTTRTENWLLTSVNHKCRIKRNHNKIQMKKNVRDCRNCDIGTLELNKWNEIFSVNCALDTYTQPTHARCCVVRILLNFQTLHRVYV